MIEVGQLVQKVRGHSDLNKIGVVCEIIKNDLGYSIIQVLIEGEEKVKSWYSLHVETLGK